MPSLHPAHAESSTGSPPLAESTARALLEIALLISAEDRAQPLTKLLADDAALAEWVHRRGRERGAGPFASPAAAADWLAPRFFDELRGDAAASDSPAVPGNAGASEPTVARLLPHGMARLARLARLESDFAALVEREKIEAMRQFAYGAGHEINNPLANISTRAQTLLRDEKDPERRRRLATINSQAFRAHEMIADMMLFAKPPQPGLAEVDPAAIIDSVLRELSAQAVQQKTRLGRIALSDVPTIVADPGQLAVAVKALCQNALEALGEGGSIEVAAAVVPESDASPNGPELEIVVRDDGPGFDENARRHLFDPFFSGREAGRGLGLGLCKCWRIASLHGGRVVVESAPGRGAKFSLRLPLAGPKRAERPGER
jgi:signal transduction histidine kinase